ARVALQPADAPQQGLSEPLLCRRSELAPSQTLRQPNRASADDQLQREKHRDQLEDVRDPARGKGQRGPREQEPEEDGKAPFLKELDQAAEGFRLVGAQPALELVAEHHSLLARLHPPSLGAGALVGTWPTNSPPDGNAKRPGCPGRSGEAAPGPALGGGGLLLRLRGLGLAV